MLSMPFSSKCPAAHSLTTSEDFSVDSFRVTDALSDGVIIAWNASDQLAIDMAVANDSIQIGSSVNTDVNFNGATAGRDIFFDASANTLRALDNAIIGVGNGDDLTLAHDATNSTITSNTGDLILNNALATGSTIVRLGTTTSATDFQVQSSTPAALFTIDGAGTITIPLAQNVLHSAGFLVPCYSNGVHQSLTGAGAMNLTSSYTRWTTTGADAGTLAAPGVAVPSGFIKKVQMIADGGDGTLTVTGLAAANDVWVFSEIGHSLTLMAVDASTWVVISDGMGDTTIGTMSAFS